MAMIAAIGGTKGGSGKSTIATNMAVMLAAAGRDVLLVDADEQGTSRDFTAMRAATRPEGPTYTCVAINGVEVARQVARLARKHDEVIIDCGGRDTNSQRAALAVCDAYLVPFAPRSFDVWTLDSVAKLVDEARATGRDFAAFAFLNRADARGPDNTEAAELLKSKPALEFLPFALGNRKAFANAASMGLGVSELRPHELKATQEVGELFQHLFGIAKVLKMNGTRG
jgi:chromosome partitioning protein